MSLARRYFSFGLILALCVCLFTPVSADEKEEKDKPAAEKKVEENKEAKAESDEKPDTESKEEENKEEEKPKLKSIFPDKALEEAVRREVFAKRNNDEPIVKEDVKNISRVIGKNRGIKELTGLEHCHAIMEIDLSGNEIVDLKPIAELGRLQSVTLAKNKITNVGPLADLTAIQLLDLSGNRVEDLSPIKRMTNLRTLLVDDNDLGSLDPISGLSKIWSLYASGNQISDLTPLAKLDWLSTLDVGGNQIESLAPLASLTELRMLLISNNKISDFGPLVEMCRRDAEGEREFVPYLNVYLGGNPIADADKAELTSALDKFGVDVFDR